MKNLSLTLAALVLFAGLSFAQQKQDDKSKTSTETTKHASTPAKTKMTNNHVEGTGKIPAQKTEKK